MQTQTSLWLERMSRLSIALVVVSALLAPRSVSAGVECDATIPQLKFAAQEIERALVEVGRKDLMVTLTVKSDSTSPEAFQIRLTEPNRVEVIGSDATGAMYGGIEVAEYLEIGSADCERETQAIRGEARDQVQHPAGCTQPFL